MCSSAAIASIATTVIASAAKQSMVSAGTLHGLLRCARNDGSSYTRNDGGAAHNDSRGLLRFCAGDTKERTIKLETVPNRFGRQDVRIISYFFLLVIILFGTTFATLNSESVTINYYFGQSTLPLSLLLVLVFALGCLIGMLVGFWMLIKSKVYNYRLKQRLHLAEKEIENLRAIPLQDKV